MVDDFKGKTNYTAALKLVASGQANTEEGATKVIQLLKVALRDGISPSDQAMAYKTMGDKYVLLDDIQASYSSIKQALTIKKTLSISDEEEKNIWHHAYEMMGLVASNIEPNDAGGAISLYKEVIAFTDHPQAHLNIGVVYAQNDDKDQACQQWEYVVNNEDKLKKYKSYYKNRESAINNLNIAKKPAEMKSGCFIATAVYGDVLSPEVACLRHYRDTVLNATKTGRAFIKFYYFTSPSIASVITKSDLLKSVVRKSLLDPLVALLKVHYQNLRNN